MRSTSTPPSSRLYAVVLLGGIPAVFGEALTTRQGAFLGGSAQLWGSIMIGLGVALMAGAIARTARG